MPTTDLTYDRSRFTIIYGRDFVTWALCALVLCCDRIFLRVAEGRAEGKKTLGSSSKFASICFCVTLFASSDIRLATIISRLGHSFSLQSTSHSKLQGVVYLETHPSHAHHHHDRTRWCQLACSSGVFLRTAARTIHASDLGVLYPTRVLPALRGPTCTPSSISSRCLSFLPPPLGTPLAASPSSSPHASSAYTGSSRKLHPTLSESHARTTGS